MSPIPRDPPVTTAVLPSMEKRSSIGMRRSLVADAEVDELAVPVDLPADVRAAHELGLDQRVEDPRGLVVAAVGRGEPTLARYRLDHAPLRERLPLHPAGRELLVVQGTGHGDRVHRSKCY